MVWCVYDGIGSFVIGVDCVVRGVIYFVVEIVVGVIYV